MYFPDKVGALRSAAEALRPGGRIAAIGFAAPERNGFFSVPIGIIRRRANLPPPAPGLPGPFSLANGAAKAALAEAGFGEIEAHAVPSPLRLRSAGECARVEGDSFGALQQMLSVL